MVILIYIANISVSTDDALRNQVKEMGHWLKDQLELYDVDTKLVDLSKIVQIPDLPNLVLGKIDGAPGNNLRTVLVYGHYDVQPVSGFSD
jgi:Cys-Gly metallodipeptidase DUG1